MRTLGALRRWRGPAVALAGLALSACGLFDNTPPPPCPSVSVLRDAAELIRYRPGPGRDMTDVVEQAKFASYKLTCDYNRNKLTVELTLDIVAEAGPAAQGREMEVPYFVAVIGPDDKILAKKVFTSVIDLPVGQRRAGVREETEQLIPLQDFQTGASFQIMIGFQLTEAELKDNRRRKQ